MVLGAVQLGDVSMSLPWVVHAVSFADFLAGNVPVIMLDEVVSCFKVVLLRWMCHPASRCFFLCSSPPVLGVRGWAHATMRKVVAKDGCDSTTREKHDRCVGWQLVCS